jgi:Fe-S-cluster containining protein
MSRIKITAADCQSCGACCVGGDVGEGWADCTEDDVLRLSPKVRDQLVPIRYGMTFNPAIGAIPMKRDATVGARCVFLRGTPGKRCACTIYDERPTICATFKPGGVGCRQMREKLELPG